MKPLYANLGAWTICGLMISSVAHAQFGIVSRAEADRKTWIAHGNGALLLAFPTLDAMRHPGKTTGKPAPYTKPKLDHQVLRVMEEFHKDAESGIMLGADELGKTELHMSVERDKKGNMSARSMAGAPGTEWILSPDKAIVCDDLRMRGLRIRVLTADYTSNGPGTTKPETIKDVVHIEIENLDPKRPGEITYLGAESEETYRLAADKGVFVFADYGPSSREKLIESRGWKRVEGPGTRPSTAPRAAILQP